jgi:hypothetical protein
VPHPEDLTSTPLGDFLTLRKRKKDTSLPWALFFSRENQSREESGGHLHVPDLTFKWIGKMIILIF